MLLDQRDEFPPAAIRSLDALVRAGQRLKDVVTGFSEWIDLAYIPGVEAKGTGLADYLDRYQHLDGSSSDAD